MKNSLVPFLLLLSVMMPVNVIAGNPSDYLILRDIGPYKLSKPEKLIPGFAPIGGPRAYDGPGVVTADGHFPDGVETTYEIMYLSGGTGNISPTVYVSLYPGGEADQWLLHELEDAFRTDDDLNESLDAPNPLKLIDNNTIFSVWGYYRWMSNNVSVSIEFTDYTGTKPEPLEVVREYLAKYPSTIPSTTKLDRNHTVTWLKNEMTRRLWLADKWAGLIQPGDVELSKKLKSMVDSMEVFLNYRAKYFAVDAKDEIEALKGLAELNNETAIRAKLTEYKEWWGAHKSESISLPERLRETEGTD